MAQQVKGFREYFVLSKGSRFFMLIQFLNGLYHAAFWVVFFLYLSSLGYEKYIIGILSGIGLYASFFTLFASGYIADRFGRKPTLIAGCVVSIFSISLFLLNPNPIFLGAASALNGMSNAMIAPSVNALLSEKEPESRRKYVFSLTQSVSLIGAAIGTIMLTSVTPLGEFFGSIQEGFFLIFYVYFLVAIYRLVCAILVKEEYKKKGKGRTKYMPTSWKVIGLFVITNIIIGFGAGMVVPWFPIYFEETFKMSLTDLGLLFALNHILWAATNLIMPVMASRFGSVKAIVVSQGMAIVLLVLLPNSTWLALAIVLYMARMILMNIAVPLANALEMNLVREEDRSTATASHMMSWQVSNGTGQMFGGFLMSMIGMSFTFYITAAIYAVYLTLFFIFFRKYKKI